MPKYLKFGNSFAAAHVVAATTNNTITTQLAFLHNNNKRSFKLLSTVKNSRVQKPIEGDRVVGVSYRVSTIIVYDAPPRQGAL